MQTMITPTEVAIGYEQWSAQRWEALCAEFDAAEESTPTCRACGREAYPSRDRYGFVFDAGFCEACQGKIMRRFGEAFKTLLVAFTPEEREFISNYTEGEDIFAQYAGE